MDREIAAGLILAVVFVGAGLLYAYENGSFREVARDDIGHKDAVWMAGAAIVVCLGAVPFAVLQGAYAARFRREADRLRAQRPAALAQDYAGPEGAGLLFEDAMGRVLLLRGPGGLGAPRLIELPPAPPLESVEPSEPAGVAELVES